MIGPVRVLYPWDAEDLGNCPKSESSRKWLGEGATGLLDPASKRPLHWCEMGSHQCKRGFGWCTRLLGDLCSLNPKGVRKTFCTLPLLATFPFWAISQVHSIPTLPPLQKLLTPKNSRGIIFGAIAAILRNQLRKSAQIIIFSKVA